MSGVGIARKDSAKQRHLLSLSNYDVRHMSVVERPASRSGRAFDITFGGENAERKRMPAKLARLERKKKGRNELTREELEEKLRKAEERRQVARAHKPHSPTHTPAPAHLHPHSHTHSQLY